MNAEFQPMVLQTSFPNVEQLLEVLVAQGEGSNLVLPHPGRIEDGEPVHFSLLLEDGQVALEGLGACIASYPTDDQQYDVIVGSVRPVEGYEEVFRALWSMRGLPMDADADVFDVDVGETEALSPTLEVESRSNRSDRREPNDQNSFLQRPRVGSLRDNIQSSRSSHPAPTGLFVYAGERLPRPSRPPRPSTSPTQRVRKHQEARPHEYNHLQENADRSISDVDADDSFEAILDGELDSTGTSNRPRSDP